MLLGRSASGIASPAFLWLVRLIAVSAVVLVPWAAYLALSLPASVSARHWPVAWAGLDVVMAAGLAATAWLAVRRDRRTAFPAVSTATLFLVDAWFDVCTAPAGRLPGAGAGRHVRRGRGGRRVPGAHGRRLACPCVGGTAGRCPVSRRALAAAGASAAAAAAAAAWWYTDSAPYPYAQRGLLDLPLPFLTNRRLDALLGIRPGERVLEIGPGTGLQALHVAGLLGSEGRLDVIDIQGEMLEHVMRRARAAGITSVAAAQADARQLPFPGATFDAAYLVTVLGEIPDPAAAVRELRRVLKPTGRLVVGEFLDRHYVPVVDLLRYGNAAGLELSGRLGPPLAYLARLRPDRSPASPQDPGQKSGWQKAALLHPPAS